MPPCLPIPILSIIRRFLTAFATYSWNAPIISFAFRSLAFPTFGYTLAGWRTAKLASSETNPDPTESMEYQSPYPDPKGSIQPPELEKAPPEFHYDPDSPISRLMNNPTLFDPLRRPRNPIVLCHGTQEAVSVTFLTTFLILGLYGFDVRGFDALPGLRIHYWSEVLRVLRREIGADVVVTRVPPYECLLIPNPADFTDFYFHSTGGVVERAERLHEHLKENASGRAINLIGHSMASQLSFFGLIS